MRVIVDSLPEAPSVCLFSKWNCEYGFVCKFSKQGCHLTKKQDCPFLLAPTPVDISNDKEIKPV